MKEKTKEYCPAYLPTDKDVRCEKEKGHTGDHGVI